jgi:hypothetical protein
VTVHNAFEYLASIPDVDRHTVTVVAIAVISVLAIGLAAATVAETVQPGAGGDGGYDGGFVDVTPPEDGGGVPAGVARVLLVLLGAGVVGILAYLLANGNRTAEVVAYLLGFAILGFLFVQIVALLFDLGDIPLFGSGLPGFGESAGETATTAVSTMVVLLGIFGLLILGVGIAFRRSDEASGDETDADSRQSTDQQPTEAVGQIAGLAADRIERREPGDEVIDNEVYRAWEEMTDRLDVPNDESTTPREFARAAAQAGLSAEDVSELTELFEDVRYGGYSPTTEREERAVDVLRRIEQSYR